MAGRRSEGLSVCLFASSSSVFSTRFFERTIFFRRYEGKQLYILITRKEFKQMSRDHLLNSKDPKKVWNFSLARRKDLFFVFGRFFVFLWDSQHDTREEERRVDVARANIRAKRRSRKRDRKKERKKEEEESIHSSVLR